MTASREMPELFDLGGLFMVGLPGLKLDDSTRKLIRDFGINKFIYFRRNAESPEQLRQLSGELRQACRDNGLAPPLIAIDQEGGTVARLPPPFTQFPDARLLAESPQPEKDLADYAGTCAAELKSIGVNYNLAPVLDVCGKGQDYFMERRALGGDPVEVARLGGLIIKELQRKGVAACAKHFPGLGAAVVDPHIELPYVAKPEEEIRLNDLLPFRHAIKLGVASIMTSHTIYRHLDQENPATLSKKILTGLLRQELGYDGVIITDDLEMGAIEKGGDVGEAASKAFAAGADLLLICRSHDKVVEAARKTYSAIDKNQALRQRMPESLQRVSSMRQRFAAEEVQAGSGR